MMTLLLDLRLPRLILIEVKLFRKDNNSFKYVENYCRL